jgi:hypothetical protein
MTGEFAMDLNPGEAWREVGKGPHQTPATKVGASALAKRGMDVIAKEEAGDRSHRLSGKSSLKCESVCDVGRGIWPVV